ncbi:MAG: hypoxanthine phosphoribosyltransferase [Bacteroidales bacterium]|nr:hypoxanthine phosphoribosyltransferase [Bacteroidales bacterium]
MDQVQILDKTFVKYIEKKDIDAACEKMAGQINEDYKNDEPILLATLNGAIIFAAELMQKLTIRCRISCIKLSSYSGTTSTNQVKQLVGLNEDISGKRVIIVEDIVDTGVTYEHMVALLKEAKVKDIAMATMAFKPTAYKKDIPVQYVGFSIPDKFVIGHGLDYDGWGRNLPDIYQLKTEN